MASRLRGTCTKPRPAGGTTAALPSSSSFASISATSTASPAGTPRTSLAVSHSGSATDCSNNTKLAVSLDAGTTDKRTTTRNLPSVQSEYVHGLMTARSPGVASKKWRPTTSCKRNAPCCTARCTTSSRSTFPLAVTVTVAKLATRWWFGIHA